MSNVFRRWSTLASAVCGLYAGLVNAAAAPRALSISGELFTAAGSPVVSPSVKFKLLVFDAADQCVLYSEEHLAEDLSHTSGRFALYLGAGSSVVNNVSTANGLDEKVFVNDGPTMVANCPSSPIALNAGDERHVRILYDLGSGYVAMAPAVPIVSSAYALVAETLAGLKPADLLQVNSAGSAALTQVNAEYAFSATNWPRLKALLDGTSGQYLGTTPTAPVDVHGQKIVNVADPVGAQDVATKHYVDGNVGGSPLDLTAVGPMIGNGSTLKWDATANTWVAGILSTVPTGSAGGDLAGTYPNPTLKNEAVTANKISLTGGGINRLLVTDATTGATIGFGTCALNQVYAWTATGFACTSVAALSPVTSVAGKSGAVVLNAADVAGLGTAAVHDVGSAANQIPLLGAGGTLPAVDGSNLTNVNAAKLQSRTVASVQPTAGQVLGWNANASQWEPTSATAGAVTNVATGTGLLGGPVTSVGTIAVDVGSAASKIVQENANAQIAQTVGSASAPAYTFVGSSDTGMYLPSTGMLSFSAAGTSALSIFPNATVAVASNFTSYQHFDQDLSISMQNPFANRAALFQAAAQSNYVGTQVIGTSGGVTTDWFAGLFGTTNYSIGSGGRSPVSIEGAAPSNTLYVNGAGLVGIGTSVPLAGLDVNQTGSASALLVPRDTTANRPTGVNGMLRYNSTSNAMEGFINGVWSTLSSGSSAGTVTNVATATGLIGGPITANGTLGVDVGSAAGKIVQQNANAQIAQLPGTVAAPSYTFAGNPNTGVFSPGANQLSFVTNGTAGVTLAANGYLGIGSTAPGRVVDAASSAYNSVSAMSIQNTSSGGAAEVNVRNDFATFAMGLNGSGGIIGESNLGYLTNPVGPIAFRTNGAERMRVQFGGNVGIGTNAPQAALDVAVTGTAGSAIIVPRDTTANRPTGVNGMLRYSTTLNALEGYINGTWATLSAGSSAGTVTNVASGTGLLGGPITSNGTIGVDVGSAAGQIVQENADAQIAQTLGTAALPSYTFVGDANTGFFSPGADQLSFVTNGTAALTITPANLVGIGTTTPSVALDVVGAVRPGDSSVVSACGSGRAQGEGSFRYNYSTHFMEYCNGTAWAQFTVQAAGSATPVQNSGPPVNASRYTFANVTGNYTPSYGAIANTYNGNWLPPGTNSNSNPNCVSLQPNSSQQIVYDLGSVMSIGNVYLSATGQPYAWMIPYVSFSLDGVTYSTSTVVTLANNPNIQYAGLSLGPAQSARYVRVTNGGNNTDTPQYTFCQIAVGP